MRCKTRDTAYDLSGEFPTYQIIWSHSYDQFKIGQERDGKLTHFNVVLLNGGQHKNYHEFIRG